MSSTRGIYEGSVVAELIGESAEAGRYEHLPHHRFSVPGYREGKSLPWHCTASRHRLPIGNGFQDVQLWIPCTRASQRVEVRLIFRPTIR
jgi:hypothetical protein